MIEAIVAFALRQRVVILVASVLLALLGLESFRRLPIEAYPDVADTWVQVIVQWPGHAPEEVERQITIPTERALAGVANKRVVRSTTIAGLSVTTLLFEENTETFFARQVVSERLTSVDYPEGAEIELGPVSSPIGEILRYRLVNCAITDAKECEPEDREQPARSLSALKDLQERVLERELTSSAGIADVTSFGGTVREYQVLADPVKLASYGLSFVDLQEALRDANGNAGGGLVVLGSQSLNVRGVGLLTPEQIADVPVRVRDGSPVRVGQVASVVAGHKPRLGRVSVDQDDDVVAGTVLLRKGYDAQRALTALHQRIDDVNRRLLPRGVKLSPYHDRSDLLHATTHTVGRNLLEGIALVTLILFVFLGNTRAALIVAVTIPLSLLFAFTGLGLVGVPANLLSMGALDFGMIVDGAIVMVENIHRELSQQGSRPLSDAQRKQLITRAARDVSRPIVFALAILITAYLPILLLEHVEGRLFRPLAITVSLALVGSLLLAVTLTPVLASYLLRGHGERPRGEQAEAEASEADAGAEPSHADAPTPALADAEPDEGEHEFALLRWLRKLYMPLLERSLRRPRAVLWVAAICAACSGLFGHLLGTEFLPQLDEGAIWLRITLPANISLKEATSLVDGVHEKEGRDFRGVREILDEYPEIKTLAVQLGRPDDGMDPVGFYNSEFLMVLKPKGEWRAQFDKDKELLIADIAKQIDALPGVSYGFSQPISDNVEEAVTGVKGQLAIKITGDDLQALDDLADQAARAIAVVPGVTDLAIFRQLGQSNIEVQIARDRAERYGLTVREVEDAIEHGVGGAVVGQIVDGELKHDLTVRFADEARDNLGALRSLMLPTQGGHLVPLAQLANIEVRGGAGRIFRENGRRTMAIKFEVRGRDMGSTVSEAQERVRASLKLPDGYDLSWAGEFESAQRAGKRLTMVIPLSLVTIFVLLFMLFRNARDASLVLGNVLLVSPIGGLAALWFSGHALSVSAAVGFLALFGVSVQTGVLLVSFVDELRREGMGVDQALLRAASLRLRPILMTALVATLGLVPAALSTGIGSDSQKPLAIVVVGGLFCSLALSLFTLPMAYKLFVAPKERP